MTLLLLPVIALVAVVAIVAGAPARRVAQWSAVAAGVAIVLGVLGLALTRGLGGEDDDEGRRADDPAVDVSPGTTIAPSSAANATPPAGLRPVDAALVAREDDDPFPAPTEPLSGLRDGQVLLVEASIERDGEVRQCRAGTEQRNDCGRGLPVPAPVDGVARFLALVEDELTTPVGTIDCVSQRCALVLFVRSENHALAELGLAFGDAAPTPKVEVAGRGPFADGEATDVVLTGFAAGETVVVTQCTPPGPADPMRCGAPASEITVEIGPAGTAVVDFPVHIGPVGESSHECRRGESCAIAVLGAAVPAAVAEISLAGSPGADVPGGRATAALVVAGLLALAALVLVARADWRPPDGDPFGDIRLTVPPGWEHLREVDLEA